jgi:hypothetical protein
VKTCEIRGKTVVGAVVFAVVVPPEFLLLIHGKQLKPRKRIALAVSARFREIRD